MKVALVHDWLTNLGGAERVVAVLHEMFPDAPIYTSVYATKRLPLLKDADIRTSWLQHWPLAQKKHQLYPMLRTLAFESFDFSEYDLVISSSSAEAKGIITPTETLHISYIHTPTRYYWSGYDDYLQNPGLGIFNPLAKLTLPRVVKKMRRWDFAAAQRPDVLIANSTTVAERIKLYYKRDAQILHPPVDVQRFAQLQNDDSDYLLVVSRLIPYKRVDLAVRACTKLNKRLIVVGDGSELKKLKALAGPTVEFRGQLPDQEVTRLFTNCRAFIFTAFEDFGITPVEAMAAGKPVIAYGKGGITDSVVHKTTGILFDNQSVESLCSAIVLFEKTQFDSKKIRSHSEKFSNEQFINAINTVIQEHLL
ncbi:glycosyltransferase [Candidatus Saccharibacteria bacterium]|nr:glycosyltransferase [Candidatus Saccharibacteria bacterium]